jgi:hypothetical protein
VINAELDRPKLERSLKKYAKAFGESSAQAVTRWAVNACRELAVETQVWGRTGTKKKQDDAILMNAYRVVMVVEELKPSGSWFVAINEGQKYGVPPENALLTSSQINEWIEVNRTRRRKRTANLPPEERKVCQRSEFNKAMRERYTRSGMAKGGWVGAGQIIARAQTGQERVMIGKNFLSYAQKHGGFGRAKKPINGWRPMAEISNAVSYSGDKQVLSNAAPAKAFAWSLKKTVKWYASSLRKLNNKKA